jgi:hypothetical protein
MLYQRMFVVLILLIASHNVVGNEPASSESTAAKAVVQKASKQPEEKLICKRIKVKGSNIKKKVCKTKAQMKYDVERSQRIMDKIHSSTSPSGN